MVVNHLLQLGLSEKEAEVYLAALQLGFCSVQKIAEKAEINRTTAYTHIRNLITRGLIKTEEKNGKAYLVAEKPEKLRHIWQTQEQEIRRRKLTLDLIMPELESLYSVEEEKISVCKYDLKDIEMARDFLVSMRSDFIYSIFNREELKQIDRVNEKDKAYAEKLLESTKLYKGIVIARVKQVNKFLQKLNTENDKVFIKYLPFVKYNIPCEFLIAQKVVTILRDKEIIIFKDKFFATSMKILFEILWQEAEPIDNL